MARSTRPRSCAACCRSSRARAHVTRISCSASTPGAPRSPTCCCRAGADVINDAWGGGRPASWRRSRRRTAPGWCAPTPAASRARTRPHRVWYDDVVGETTAYLLERADAALAAGVRRDGIVIDPAHDFGKNSRHSLLLTRRTDVLVQTGWPVLVAMSRKDFVGEVLDLPPDDRLEGTLGGDGDRGLAGRADVPRPRRDGHAAGAADGGGDSRRRRSRRRPAGAGVSIRAVAFVPCAPLLIPQVAGGSAHLDKDVRAAGLRAVASAIGGGPDEVVVVAPAAPSGEWAQDSTWDFSGFGVARRPLGSPADVALGAGDRRLAA